MPVTLNHITTVAGGSVTFVTSGDQAFTSGRHIWLVAFVQREGDSGSTFQFTVTDDATTNSPTWTQRGASGDLLNSFGTDWASQVRVFSSTELTANETFAVDVEGFDGVDVGRHALVVIEATGGDGTLEQAAGFASAEATTTSVSLGTAPTERQLISGFGSIASGSRTYATAPTDWTDLPGGSVSTVTADSIESSANTGTSETWGFASGQVYLMALAFLEFAEASTGDATASPAAIATTAALPAPTSVGQSSATATPATAPLTTALPAPEASIGVATAAIARTTTVPAADNSVGAAPNQIPATTTVEVPASVGQQSTNANPASIDSTTTLPGPGAAIGASPATIAATATLQSLAASITAAPTTIPTAAALPTVASAGQGSTTAAPATITAIAGIDHPDVTITATPAAITITTNLPPATNVGQGATNATATPPTITATTQIGDTAVSITATPAAIAAITTLQTPQVDLGAEANPAVIAALAALLDPDISIGASPAALALTVTIPRVANAGDTPAIVLHVAHRARLGSPRHTARLAPPRHTARIGT